MTSEIERILQFFFVNAIEIHQAKHAFKKKSVSEKTSFCMMLNKIYTRIN